MAKTLNFCNAILIFLAFISCLRILNTEARPIKHMNKQDSLSGNRQSQAASFTDSVESSTEDFRPTDPGYSPGVGHPKSPVTSSRTPDHNDNTQKVHENVQQSSSEVHSVSLDATPASSTDDFRPTAPGYSPGVGHPKSLVTSSSTPDNTHNVPENVQQPSSEHRVSFDSSIESSTDYFRPTASGFSPGVGHKKVTGTSSNVEYSVMDIPDHKVQQSLAGKDKKMSAPNGLDASAVASKDNFRPTAPGFSPGVGHPKSLVSTNYETEYSVTGSKDDYRPTQPGHSPGVGHSYHNAAQNNMH